MRKHELERQVLEILKEIAPETEGLEIDRNVSFRDQFDFDSVDFLSFIFALEKKFEVKISELDYPGLSSLEGCVAYLSNRSGSR